MILTALASLWAIRLQVKLRSARHRVKKLERESLAAVSEAQAARQQLESVLDSITDVFVTLDREWRFTYLNRQAERFLDAPREQLIGKNAWDVFPEAVGLAFHREGMRLLKEQVPVEFEEYYPPLSCWFSVRAYPSSDGVTAYFQEITKRRRAEEELRNLSQVVEQTADSVLITDRTGRIEYANPAFLQLTGYSRGEVLGQTPRLLRSEKQSADVYADLWKTILGGNVFRGVLINRKKNGECFYTQKTITPLRDERGEVLRFVSTDRDITESKRAEEALRRSEASLAEAQRIAHLGNWEWDLRTNELRWSEEIYRIFGLHSDGATYRTFLEAVHPADRESVMSAAEAALAGRAPYDIEHRVIRPDGSERFVHEQAEVAYDDAGQPVRMLGTVQDFTERKFTELALAAANEHLLRVEVEKKRFYSSLLGAVTGGKLHLGDSPLEIPATGAELFQSPLDPSGNYAPLRARLLEVTRGSGMDPEVGDRVVLAAGEAITNAIKHGIQGRCQVRRTEDQIIVRVSDEGPGISPEALPSSLLIPGFSTKLSLGMGYTLMLDLADSIWLATGSGGTVVQLEHWIRPEEHPQSSIEDILARF